MTGTQRLIASSGCATESRGCEHQNQEGRRNGGATHGISFLDAIAPRRLAVRPTFQVTGGSFPACFRVTGYTEAIQKSSLSERSGEWSCVRKEWEEPANLFLAWLVSVFCDLESLGALNARRVRTIILLQNGAWVLYASYVNFGISRLNKGPA